MSAFETRFGLQAGAYRAFRPPWPDEVFARILARVPEPRGTAVDLGAGTGLVALRLARSFARVLAVEPDERMLTQLEELANLERLRARAEEVELSPAGADLVTIGNALHWMDGARVVERARAALRSGGTLAVFRYDPPHAAHGALETLLGREYSEAWHAHVHARLRDPGYARRTLEASSFGAELEARVIPNDLTLSLAELLGFLRSTSYAGGHARALGDPEVYWQALEARILAAAGPGPFVLDFRVELLLARKTSSLDGVTWT